MQLAYTILNHSKLMTFWVILRFVPPLEFGRTLAVNISLCNITSYVIDFYPLKRYRIYHIDLQQMLKKYQLIIKQYNVYYKNLYTIGEIYINCYILILSGNTVKMNPIYDSIFGYRGTILGLWHLDEVIGESNLVI